MKKFIFSILSLTLWLALPAQNTLSNSSPTPIEESEPRCFSTDYEAYLKEINPERSTIEEFENWMSKQRTELAEQALLRNENEEPEIFTIPIIFHIIHRGESVGNGTNIAAAQVYEQIDQLNRDFAQTPGTLSESNHPDAANVHIEFCPALYDEAGNELPEPGIDRVNALTHFPPIGPGYYTGLVEFDDLVKRNTFWNPDEYMNFWSAELVSVLLGYAQFPEAPCLGGIGTGNGNADTDGIVCNYFTIGGENSPGSSSTSGLGRTATHEVGHWLGLRHIWGDGGCSASDFCEDTPGASDSSSGCQIGKNTCDDSNNPYFNGQDPDDMVQNYMDYSRDFCMNLFTNVQRDRMRIVMGELTGRDCEGGSPRRASLASSTKCTPANSILFRDGNEGVFNNEIATALFPNPATNQVFIELDYQIDVEQLSVQVSNQLGQAVAIPINRQGQQIELNTSNLTAGIYYVVLDNGHTQKVQRFVINK